MKKTKIAHRKPRQTLPRPRVLAPSGRNGAVKLALTREDVFLREPKNELELAIQRYVDLYDFAPIAYVSFDRAGRIEEANLAATDLLGLPRDLLIGRPFALFLADSDLFLRHLLYCRTSDQRVETELQLKSRKGEQVPAQLSSVPITSTSKNGARLYQTAIIDLRDRKRAEDNLRLSETRYRTLFDLVPVAVYACDANGVIQQFNRRAVELWGREPNIDIAKEKFCGSLKIYYPDGRFMPHKDCPMAKALRGERLAANDLEIVVEQSDGKRRNVVVAPRTLTNKHGEIIGAINCLYDITERKLAETALEKSKELLEKLVQQRTTALRAANAELENEIRRRKGVEGEILAISDREQQRFGQELHDGLCQQLTAIGLIARATALRLKNHRVIEVKDLEKIARLVNHSARSARDIARDLHKEKIDAATFETALRDLVRRELWKTPCQLVLKTDTNIHDDTVASELYRILREAFINANKHARATQIVLEVRRERNQLVCSVSDNGVGLNGKNNKGRGLGFQIMNYRAQSIGARLKVEMPRRGGTRLSVYLPQAN
jgi:PAS domain S-box-containing protein